VNVVMLLPNNPYPHDTRVRQEAETLTADGHHVTVVCPRAPAQRRRETVNGVDVWRYPLPIEGEGMVSYLLEYAMVTLASLVACMVLLARRKLDVVHVHNPPDTLVVAAAFAKLFGKQFVFDHHDLAPEMYNARFGSRARPALRRVLVALERFNCRLADHVIATNESYRRAERARDGVLDDRATIVRNGPPAGRFAAVQPDMRARAGAEMLICYAGAMGPQDGVDYLVRAMDVLVHDLGRSEARCHLLGGGDAAAAAQALAAKLGLSDHIYFTGWLTGDEYLSHLAAADICVEPAPSTEYNEASTTIKILEYMALGKPIVAFDLREHRVSAADAALYVEPDDESAMAKAIAHLCEHPDLRRELGAIGRRRIRDQLSWDHSAPHLLHVYRSLARGAK
jgi:glycosyltransferase involved in cell wall biosynthesis